MLRKILSLARQSGVYGIGSIAARAVAFLLLPYYSHLMPPAEFGAYSLFLVLVTILQPLYVHGTDIAFLRYGADASVEDQKRALGAALTQGLLVGGMLSAMLIVMAMPLAEMVVSGSSDQGGVMIRLGALTMLLDTLTSYFFIYLRIKHRALLFSLLKLANVLFNIGLNIYFVGVMKMGAVGAFYAFLYTSAASFLTLLIYLGRDVKPGWTIKSAKQWLAFGLPNLPAMLFMAAIEFSDRKWIESLLDIKEAGIYSAGYRIGMLMNMVAQSFRFAWQPFFLQHSKDTDARDTYARVMTYYIAFSGLLWLGCTFFLGDLLRLKLPVVGALIHPSYWDGFKVFPIIMLAHVFNGIYANLMVGVYLKDKTKIIPVVIGAAAVVNVVGNGLLIPRFGYMASAWLTVASYSLMVALMYLYISPRYSIPYEFGRIFKIIASVSIGWFLSTLEIGNWIVVWKVLLISLVMLYWYFSVLIASERQAIRTVLKKHNFQSR